MIRLLAALTLLAIAGCSSAYHEPGADAYCARLYAAHVPANERGNCP